nr:anaerobic ribonucleoside-triphosphate reductase [bacterium]
MITQIVKRDGRTVPFQLEKIADAIFKAFQGSGSAKGYETALELARHVEDLLEHDESIGTPTVEQIQDTVEKVLIEGGFVRTARAYILYRAERTRVREMNTRLMKIYEDITFKSAKDSDIKRENANIDGDTAMGTMLKYGSEGAKQFYEMYVLKPEHAKAHREGDIHIHDLDFLTLTTTCCQIDLLKMFKGGFCTGHGVLREPNDILSYSALACIAIQANQNDQHGGQSIVNFDYGMAPGVAKSYIKLYRSNLKKALELLGGATVEDGTLKDMIADIRSRTGEGPSLSHSDTYRQEEAAALAAMGIDDDTIARAQDFACTNADAEVDRATYQAMEAFIHNLNTMHSRAGAQTPFSSINYGMDTSPEGRMVMKNVMLATEAGLGHHETPIFPIQIFRVKEGINYNPGEPNYDLFQLACRTSARRLFPNFSFQDSPYNLQYYKPGHPETEIAYMGCRTRVISNIYDPSQEISNGRGNLSFTSINLPRIAIKSNRDISFFFEELDRKIDLCIDQLLERFEIQAQKTVRNFPFLMGEGVWLDSE